MITLSKPGIPQNCTVKLTGASRDRVARAMAVEGYRVWSEFCRVALTEKCTATELRVKREEA